MLLQTELVQIINIGIFWTKSFVGYTVDVIKITKKHQTTVKSMQEELLESFVILETFP